MQEDSSSRLSVVLQNPLNIYKPIRDYLAELLEVPAGNILFFGDGSEIASNYECVLIQDQSARENCLVKMNQLPGLYFEYGYALMKLNNEYSLIGLGSCPRFSTQIIAAKNLTKKMSF